MSDGARWYVVHTYSGYENKVAATIQKTVENRGLQELIFDVRAVSYTHLDVYKRQAFDMMEKPRADITAVTMPCFGTSRRTRDNAEKLCSGLGITLKAVSYTHLSPLRLWV